MASPLYRKIADDLRTKIESGELPKGSRLATDAELGKQYDASRNSVRDAIKWLHTLGLVETRPGQGTFVVEKVSPFVTTLTSGPKAPFGGESSSYPAEVAVSGRTRTRSGPRVDIQQASAEIATALQLDEGALVVSRHQQQFIDYTPWSLQTSFYPMSLVERGAARLIMPEDIAEGVVAYTANECGIRQVGYSDVISVRTPDEYEAAFFMIPADGQVSIFDIKRTAFNQEGDPMRVTITVVLTDRDLSVVNISDVPRRSAMTAH